MADPLALTSIVAHQWQCDHFGHLNSRHYAAAFDDALFIFWGRLGMVPPALGQPGVMPVTAELKISYRSEAGTGTVARLTGRPLRVGTKSATLAFEMAEEGRGRLLASCEAVEVFFDMQARESRPIPDPLRQALTGLLPQN